MLVVLPRIKPWIYFRSSPLRIKAVFHYWNYFANEESCVFYLIFFTCFLYIINGCTCLRCTGVLVSHHLNSFFATFTTQFLRISILLYAVLLHLGAI
ncbi:hypothetical protein GQ44DRAFT_417887 [Phaeosphaeriaceae sp. PMI808]|nr:hypothetical protein GQ44DRAFT_417887 [Phaeosphaeriaceae sp. PMI808]